MRCRGRGCPSTRPSSGRTRRRASAGSPARRSARAACRRPSRRVRPSGVNAKSSGPVIRPAASSSASARLRFAVIRSARGGCQPIALMGDGARTNVINPSAATTAPIRASQFVVNSPASRTSSLSAAPASGRGCWCGGPVSPAWDRNAGGWAARWSCLPPFRDDRAVHPEVLCEPATFRPGAALGDESHDAGACV